MDRSAFCDDTTEGRPFLPVEWIQKEDKEIMTKKDFRINKQYYFHYLQFQ